MLGIQVVEVALSLALVFFLAAVICSAVHEGVAGALAWRAKDLQRGLRRLLDDGTQQPPRALLDTAGPPPGAADDGQAPLSVRQLLQHPQIAALATPRLALPRVVLRRSDGSRQLAGSSGELRVPSYIPPARFSAALLDLLAPEPGNDAMAALRQAVDALPDGALRTNLRVLLNQAAGDLEAFRGKLEGWFDDTMERISGRYRRRAALFMLLYGALLALSLNLDAVSITRNLWTDDAVRGAVLAQAQALASESDTGQTDQAVLERVASGVAELQQLQLPVLWRPGEQIDVLAKLVGLAITAGAAALGGPFWFDVVNKFAGLRASGPRAPGSGRASPDETGVQGNL